MVEICAHEHLNLAERMRMLVLCDHERAGATLPADLTGVIDQQAGSAHAMLEALVAAPETGGLNPMLVTGKTVAGAAGHAARRSSPGCPTAPWPRRCGSSRSTRARRSQQVVGPWDDPRLGRRW